MSLLNMLFGNNADREVNVDQVADALKVESHTLLDVRELDEWNQARVKGSVHIPMSELHKRIAELPKGKPVYAICHSGSRSLYAVNVLEQAGFAESRSVAGGIAAWAKSGKPLTR